MCSSKKQKKDMYITFPNKMQQQTKNEKLVYKHRLAIHKIPRIAKDFCVFFAPILLISVPPVKLCQQSPVYALRCNKAASL